MMVHFPLTTFKIISFDNLIIMCVTAGATEFIELGVCCTFWKCNFAFYRNHINGPTAFEADFLRICLHFKFNHVFVSLDMSFHVITAQHSTAWL